ncbi:MAG: phosphoribosylamine--glycine ligase [Myxococcota bacterium]|jgi:phosphoribosylamine--glycine ligase
MTAHRFLFISKEGLSLDLAWRLAQEGHGVRMYIERVEQRDVGDGFVDKVSDYREHLDWSSVVLVDDTLGLGALADDLRAKGHKVIGGTAYTDRLEDDREFGQSELDAHNIPTLSSKTFASFDDAIAYVQANPARYVFKPAGEDPTIKRLLYLGRSEDGQDVAQLLAAYKETWGERIGPFQLQRHCTGVEVGLTAFFDGERFLTPLCVHFEYKRLFPGDLGPMTGHMGIALYWSKPNRLFHETLGKLAPKLSEVGYVGSIDVNCIATADNVYPLEFTSRFGYPTLLIQLEGMRVALGDFFAGLANGQAPPLKVDPGFLVGINVRVPPFPYNDTALFNSFARNRRVMFRTDDRAGIHIQDLKQDNGQWMLAGQDACPLLSVGSGETMEQARKQAIARIDNVLLPNLYYRQDLGERWSEDVDRLLAWGWLGA